ncbi:zinc-finger domain-containing protein [Francisella halioticida]|uniref:Zinc-finger domain-containing protein n=1 Tax=Francisella halioticida TaxID=549298 RepID=A0ABM6LX79_9GAMM|nr:zinc-finger domain-containing protein [Francisella halioticida]ASG67180.1 zinc-finger domain-containing protein [Francisella halioticida]
MKKEQKIIKVRPGERICCPTKYHENWNLHPRVYIDLEDKKTNTCPYCGTTFKVEK